MAIPLIQFLTRGPICTDYAANYGLQLSPFAPYWQTVRLCSGAWKDLRGFENLADTLTQYASCRHFATANPCS
jgi:hypothetical protein